MNKTWPTKKLGEIIKLHYGRGITRQDRKPAGKYPIYGANGELGRTDKFLVEGDALIIGRKGSAGEVTRVSGKFWPADVTYYVFGNEQIDIDYLFYVLRWLDLRQLVTGIKPGINRNKVYELEVSLPPLAEQKRIVEKIEKLFAKIDEASRFRAESSAASASLLPSALHQMFNSKIKNQKSKLQFKIQKLPEVAEINPSKRGISDLPEDTEASFVPMAALSEKTQSIEGQEVRKLREVKKGYTYFRDGDVLFAKITPCMENGKVAIASGLKNGIGFGSTEFHVLRAKESVLPRWIFYFVWNPEFRKVAERHMTGTAGQQRVPVEFLENTKIPLPPIAEQKKIVAYLDNLSEKARKLQELQKAQLVDFARLRQSLLAKAFSKEL